MSAKSKILYIHHAGCFGGAFTSLVYMIEGIDQQNFDPVVACIYPTTDVLEQCRQAGAEAFFIPGIREFGHTTGGWYPLYSPIGLYSLINRLFYFYPSIKHTKELVEDVKPDVVHLNSLVLAPSAIGAKKTGVPIVWHVRESVVNGHFGLRKRLLRKLLISCSDEIIFISADNRTQILGSQKAGTLIPDFVDFKRFDHSISGKATRDELGIQQEDKIILFLGGRGVIKGIFPLLKALPKVKMQVSQMHCIIACGEYVPSGRLVSRIARRLLPLINYGTVAQRVDKLMDHDNMHGYVHMLPWREDIELLIAASDVVVVPSVKPHFARPVVEAGAMAKPVVASRIGGVEETVEDNKTGILVEPENAEELAKALITILSSKEIAETMGQQALRHARYYYDSNDAISKTSRIYDDLIEKTSTSKAVKCK